MRILTRPRLLAGATLVLALAGAMHYLGPARADDRGGSAVSGLRPAPEHAKNLITGSGNDAQQPQTMEEFLTAVTTDVDGYWEKVFAASNLPTPKVSYAWIPAGQTAASACGGDSGTLGDSAAAYCPGDDTIYISQRFASGIYDGSLDGSLPGSSQGYGQATGDFAVAYIVAHEYGHQVQDELGLFERYGDQVPTMAFELQADCFAGTWAHSAAAEDRLEDGDLERRSTPPWRSATSMRASPAITARPSSARRRGGTGSTRVTRPRATGTSSRAPACRRRRRITMRPRYGRRSLAPQSGAGSHDGEARQRSEQSSTRPRRAAHRRGRVVERHQVDLGRGSRPRRSGRRDRAG